MKAKDILRDRVDLVLELRRYKKALRKIVDMKEWRDSDERDAPDVPEVCAVAEEALQRRKARGTK